MSTTNSAGGRSRPGRRAAVVLIAALGLAGCKDVLQSVQPPGGGSSNNSCGLVLKTKQGPPGSSLIITGIPAAQTVDSLDARFRVRESEVGEASLVYRLGGDTAAVLVPFHPSGPRSTGQVELVFRTSTQTCYLGQVTITALPAAEGAAERVSSALTGALTASMQRLELDPEVLKGDPASWPEEVRPYGVMQMLLDHPQNPNSLARLLDGTAPALGGEQVDMAVLESVLATSGFVDAVEASAAALQAAPEGAASSARADVKGKAAAAATAEEGATATGTLSAQRLDELMRQQAAMAKATTLDAKRINAAVGNLVALLGFIPQLKAATTVASWYLYFSGIWTEMGEATLPKTLSPITFDVTPAWLPEGGKEAGQWHDAEVTAEGGTYQLGLTTVVDGMLNALGEPAESGVRAFIKVNPALLDRILDGVKPMTDALIGQLNMLVDTKVINFEPDLKLYKIGPYEYGPAIVSDAKWVTPSVEPAGVIQIPASDRRSYLPVKEGSAELVLRTVEGRFGGKRSEGRMTIQVGGGKVDVSPANASVRLGEVVEYRALVTGLEDQRVTWSASGGVIDQEGHWTAPQRTGSYTITATSQASPAAKGTATVEVRSGVFVRVTPAEAWVEVGKTKTFIATVEDATDTRVKWRATGGTITQDGEFTAPAEPDARITITAVSVQDTTAKGYAEVRVEAQSPFATAIIYPPWGTRDDQVMYVAVAPTGQVTGTLGWSWTWSPFRWTEGIYSQTPSTAGYEFAGAFDVNGLGHVAGSVNNPDTGEFGAVLWTGDGMTWLTRASYTDRAYAISEEDHVVGQYRGSNGYHQPFLWKLGVLTDLPLPEGIEGADAWDVNDAGVVVGQTAVSSGSAGLIWTGGKVSSPAGLALAAGINDRNQIVGATLVGGKPRAVVWENGTMRELGALSGGASVASHVNDLGHVVGWATVTGDQNGYCRPVLWRDGRIFDLSAYLPDGVLVRLARCISPSLQPDPEREYVDLGEGGHVVVRGYDTATQHEVAVIMVPR